MRVATVRKVLWRRTVRQVEGSAIGLRHNTPDSV